MSSSNPGPATTTGSNTLGGGSPVQHGATASSLIGFWGATPTTQPTAAAQGVLATMTLVSGGVGFTTTAECSALVALVSAMQTALVTIGIMKGS